MDVSTSVAIGDLELRPRGQRWRIGKRANPLASATLHQLPNREFDELDLPTAELLSPSLSVFGIGRFISRCIADLEHLRREGQLEKAEDSAQRRFGEANEILVGHLVKAYARKAIAEFRPVLLSRAPICGAMIDRSHPSHADGRARDIPWITHDVKKTSVREELRQTVNVGVNGEPEHRSPVAVASIGFGDEAARGPHIVAATIKEIGRAHV